MAEDLRSVGRRAIDIVPRLNLSGLGSLVGAEVAKFQATIATAAGKGLEANLTASSAGLASAGNLLSKTLTPAMLGLGVASIVAGENYASGSRIIEQRTNATGAQLAGLEDSYKAMAQTSAASFSTQAEVEGQLYSVLGLTGKALEDRTRQFLVLGRITGDGAPQIKQITDAFAQFSISTADQSKEMDRLYAASAAAGVPLNQLLAQINSGAPQLKGFGLNLDQSTSLLAAFGKAGIEPTKVLAALQIALKKAPSGTDPGDFLGQTLARLHELAKTDPSKAFSEGAKTFGRSYLPLVQAVAEGKVNVDAMTKALESSAGAIQRVGENTKPLSVTFKQLGNQAQIVAAALGKPLAEGASQGLGAVVSIGGEAASVIGELPGPLNDMAAGFLIATAAAGPVLKIGSGLINLGKSARDAAKGVDAWRQAHIGSAASTQQFVQAQQAAKSALDARAAAQVQLDQALAKQASTGLKVASTEKDVAAKEANAIAAQQVAAADTENAAAARAATQAENQLSASQAKAAAAKQLNAVATEEVTAAQGELVVADEAVVAANAEVSTSAVAGVGALGGVGVAIAAVAAGFAFMSSQGDHAATSTEGVASAMKLLADKGVVSGDLVRLFGENLTKVKGDLDKLGQLKGDPDLYATKLSHLRDQYNGIDSELKGLVDSGHADQARAQLEAFAAGSGRSVKDLLPLLDQYTESVKSNKGQTQVNTAEQQKASRQASILGQTYNEASGATDKLTASQQHLADSYGLDAQGAKDMQSQIDDLISTEFGAIDADHSLEAARRAQQTAATDLSDAQKHLNDLTSGYAPDSEEAKRATEAVTSAQKDLADKQQSVADAIKSVADARRDATKADEDGVKKLQDLARAAEDAANKQTDAQDALNKAIATGADHHEIEKLRRDLKRATEDSQQAAQDQAKGPAEVAQAKQDAADKIAEAERSVTKAQADQNDSAGKLAQAQHDLDLILHGGSGTAAELAAAHKAVEDKLIAVRDASWNLQKSELDAAKIHKHLSDVMNDSIPIIRETMDELERAGLAGSDPYRGLAGQIAKKEPITGTNLWGNNPTSPAVSLGQGGTNLFGGKSKDPVVTELQKIGKSNDQINTAISALNRMARQAAPVSTASAGPTVEQQLSASGL